MSRNVSVQRLGAPRGLFRVHITGLTEILRRLRVDRFNAMATAFRRVWLKKGSRMYHAGLQRTIRYRMVEGPPLALPTVVKKGHDHPLVETLQLYRGFKIVETSENETFVGITKGQPRSQSQNNMEVVAKRNEHGFVNPDTGRRVPARPFNRPTFYRMRPKIFEMAKSEWNKLNKSMFGF